MKDIDEATRLTIELAKLLIHEMQAMSLPWKKAFLRLEVHEDRQMAKGSYVLDTGVQLFDVLNHKPMFSAAKDIAPRLRDAMSKDGKKWCIALLTVDSTFNYEIEYEYLNPERWAISKLGGNNGIPVGYVA
jgi:hypothetical protein